MHKTKVNLLFGIIVAILGATAVVSMVLNQNPPVIREAPVTAAGTGLPQNHPPIDSARMEAAQRLPELEQLSAENPQNADYKAEIGNIYYDIGQYEKAIEAYGQSLQLKPQEAAVETDMATAYHYLGQPDKALDILERVLKYRPNFPQALYNKGVVLQAGKNDPKGAIAAWETLLQTNPGFPQKAELERRLQQLKSGARQNGAAP